MPFNSWDLIASSNLLRAIVMGPNGKCKWRLDCTPHVARKWEPINGGLVVAGAGLPMPTYPELVGFRR